MSVELFAADVSTYQCPVDDAYTRQWLIFRGGDGSIDTNAGQNLAWCRKAKADGRLLGFTIYWVYRPGDVDNILRYCDQLGAPTDCHMMIDAESWGGQITGNRSSELNTLAAALRKRQGGNSFLVWGYGNQNDLASLWAPRPSWLRLVVAGYSTSKPGLANMVGWQYSDGETKWPVPSGWPRSSAPFGACDHNRLYLTDQDIGDDMTPDECRAVVRDEINRVLHNDKGAPVSVRTLIYEGVNRVLEGADGKPHSVNTLVWQNVKPLADQIDALAAAVGKIADPAAADAKAIVAELAAVLAAGTKGS